MNGLIAFVSYQWSFLALAVLLVLDMICAYRAGMDTGTWIYDLSQDLSRERDVEVAHDQPNA